MIASLLLPLLALSTSAYGFTEIFDFSMLYETLTGTKPKRESANPPYNPDDGVKLESFQKVATQDPEAAIGFRGFKSVPLPPPSGVESSKPSRMAWCGTAFNHLWRSNWGKGVLATVALTGTTLSVKFVVQVFEFLRRYPPDEPIERLVATVVDQKMEDKTKREALAYFTAPKCFKTERCTRAATRLASNPYLSPEFARELRAAVAANRRNR
jgi:hypothetical protein